MTVSPRRIRVINPNSNPRRSYRPSFGISLPTLAPAPANAQNQNMEVIHHSNYDKNVFMPFVPAIKIKSGKIQVILAGAKLKKNC